MKKIKIAFAALTAVAGIGGAYAATHQDSANRASTIYRWHTAGGKVLFTTTVPRAQQLGSCSGGNQFCLRGTAVSPNPVVPTVTLQKP